MRARRDATTRGSKSGEKRYHQRLALYPMTPMRAARQTGTSPPTRITKPKIVRLIITIRIHGRNDLKKRERKMMSIITFDPLTTMMCMSHDALRDSRSSASRFVLCPRSIPARISCPVDGKIISNCVSSQRRMRTKILYVSGGIRSC